jgi:elongation factor G
MNYLKEWSSSVISLPSAKLRKAVEVEGLRDKHLGPRWEYAKVKLRIEPAESFEVGFEMPRIAGSERATFMDAVIMGLLDVVVVMETSPMIDIRVTLVELIEHEVDSSQRAFRMAGRDAGQNLLRMAREQTFVPPQ